MSRTHTVLLIEDNKGVRESTADLLRGAGYAVIEAPDGIEAMLRLSSENVDLVLLDVALPRLDGRYVLDAQPNPPPVVVVSALEYFSQEALRARFGSKVFAFLQKPVAPEHLLAVVAEAASAGGARGV